jgi:hypothetical protein
MVTKLKLTVGLVEGWTEEGSRVGTVLGRKEGFRVGEEVVHFFAVGIEVGFLVGGEVVVGLIVGAEDFGLLLGFLLGP